MRRHKQHRRTLACGAVRRCCRQCDYPSEDDLPSKLDNASWVGRSDLAKVAIVWIVADRSADIRRGERVESVLGVIEEVKALHAELKCDSFGEFEILTDTYVPVVDTGSTDDIASTIAELTD